MRWHPADLQLDHMLTARHCICNACFLNGIDDAGEKVVLEDACDNRETVGHGLAGGGGGGGAGNDTLLVCNIV